MHVDIQNHDLDVEVVVETLPESAEDVFATILTLVLVGLSFVVAVFRSILG